MIKIHKKLTVIGLIFMLSSCLVSKNYVSPEVDYQTLTHLDTAMQNADSISIISWEKFFKDDELKSMIDSALQNNFDIRKAEQRILAAEAYFKEGKAGWWPSVNVSPQVSNQTFSENSQFGSIFQGSLTQYDFSANLSWEADIWGKIRSQKRAGAAEYQQSKAAQKAVKTQLIAQIAITYYDLLAADQRRKIIEETIENRKQNLSTIKALKDAGEMTSLAVHQADAQVEGAKVLLEGVKNQIFTLQNTLAMLLSKRKNNFTLNPLEQQKVDTSFIDTIPAEMLMNRPDVQVAEQDFRYFFEQKNIARTSMFPTIKITASGGFQSLDISNWFNPLSIFSEFIGGLTQPIFQRRALKTQFEVTTFQMQERLINYNQTLFRASNEVSNTMFQFQTIMRQLKHMKNQVDDLQKGLDAAEELLKNGSANYLEILNVQSVILNTRLQKVEMQAARLKSLSRLYKALGGGAN